MMMVQQNETLRKHAFGPFRTLLGAISKDPAMLFWLDNQFNVKGKPNENFARELFELFTLGIDHYSEKDIQEASRAFTGWSIRRTARGAGQQGRPSAEFVLRSGLADTEAKTVLGKTGNLSGEDVLDWVCQLPRTSEYLVTKLWEWFAYPNPEPALVQSLAKSYRESGLHTGELLRTMANRPEFTSDKAERSIYKNPVDFSIVAMRQLGIGRIVREQMLGPDGRIRRIGPAATAAQSMRGMGMLLFYPPDVAGWEGGASWVSSATMVERIGFAERLFGRPSGQGRNRKAALQFPAYPLLAGDPSPMGVAKRLASIFDAPVNEPILKQLEMAAAKSMGSGLTQENANPTAIAVTRLLFALPSYQFC
jgi:uncharacterized protein (DUF1800 family)